MLEIKVNEAEDAARIIAIGVDGTDSNTVDCMVDEDIAGIKFIGINTGKQVLQLCKVPTAMQIGEKLIKGLGVGAKPEIGRKAARESLEELTQAIRDADMVFIAYGMGGGTGTGTIPVVAKITRDMGILTVGIVTKLFRFEVKTRMTNAVAGIGRLKESAGTLVVILNDELLEIVNRRTTMPDTLKKADGVLQQAVQGITDLTNVPRFINLDFADIQAVMVNKGTVHIGIGHAKGDEKAAETVKQAVSSPLLETTIEGAPHVIINISDGVSLIEVSGAASCVQELTDGDANITFGTMYDEVAQDETGIMVTVIGPDSHRGATPVNKTTTGLDSFGQPAVPVKETAVTAPHAPQHTQPQDGYAQPQGDYTQPHAPAYTAPTPTPTPNPSQGVYWPVQKDIQINTPDFLGNKR